MTAPNDFIASTVAIISSEKSIFDTLQVPSLKAAHITALCAILFDGGILTSPFNFFG